MVRSVAKAKPFVIGGVKVLPGERKMVDLPVTRLYTHTPVSLAVHVLQGSRPGPSLFVSAAVHGDELNGIEIIRRLLNYSGLRQLRGTLMAIPIVNVLGFLNRSRYFPDRRDLNRFFPGTSKGALAGQTAALFMEHIVSASTHGIDLHTGAVHLTNLPQTRGMSKDPAIEDMARAFNAPIHLHTDLRAGSMRHAAYEAGIPVLLYEAGEALRLDEIAIRAGLQGILRVMRHLGMLPKRSTIPTACGELCAAYSSRWIRAPTSGLAQLTKPLGSRVCEGERLATITNPLGMDVTDVTATREGVIIGLSNLPVVTQGDALFHIAFVPNAAVLEEMVQESLDLFHEDFEYSLIR